MSIRPEENNISYELFFDLHLDLLAISDAEGNFVKVNNAWKTVLGYEEEELIGLPFTALLHPDDINMSIGEIDTAKKDDTAIAATNRQRHKDGHYLYFQWNTHLIGSNIYGSGRNVTYFKDREEELRKNQVRLQAMLESQTSYLIRLNLDFKYNYVNKKYKEEFEWLHDNRDLVGEDCALSILPESVDNVANLMTQCINEPGTAHQVEVYKPGKDGNAIITLWDCICLTDVTGTPIELQCLGINITERRLLEDKQKLEQESALLEMSTPITELWDNILLLPLVGMVTAQRAQSVMGSVLKKIADTQSKVLILDISGVPVVDTAVANHFIKLSKATRLMGCLCTMSGISPAVSQTIVDLGIQIEEINTTGTMKDALEKALACTGSKLISVKDYNALKKA